MRPCTDHSSSCLAAPRGRLTAGKKASGILPLLFVESLPQRIPILLQNGQQFQFLFLNSIGSMMKVFRAVSC
jgi:hypothetical protein